MSAERLHALLAEVQAELATTTRLDDRGRAQVLKTMGDLASLLERTSRADEASEEEESLGARLEEAARTFEAEHPQLFGALQQIADTLRGGGI